MTKTPIKDLFEDFIETVLEPNGISPDLDDPNFNNVLLAFYAGATSTFASIYQSNELPEEQAIEFQVNIRKEILDHRDWLRAGMPKRKQ